MTRRRHLRRLAFAAGLLLAPVAAPAAAQREEILELAPGRRVTLAVPPGFAVERPADPAAPPELRLRDAAGTVSLDLAFLPDPEGRAATPRARRERLVELFQEHVAASVEQAMRFEELEPRRGAGTWCLFTDRALIDRAELPPNEYRLLAVGVKAWPGVMVVFRLFSQDAEGSAHRAAWAILRESVEERPVPLR
ncbi:MAG: hypothetical protein ACO3G4_06800 [Opitutaceae bacterium]